MEHTYILPDEVGNPKTETTDRGAVIMIGANGSGKSHLGAWMEKNDPGRTHRLSAQRSLNFNDDFVKKSLPQARDDFLYGKPLTEGLRNDRKRRANKSKRWGNGKETTTLTVDFDDVLALLWAKNADDATRFREMCRNSRDNKSEYPDPDEHPSAFETLTGLWNGVFPERELFFDEDGRLRTRMKGVKEGYPSTDMSDGERAVLYLVAATLCVPDGYTLIVDEPELHIHPSITDRLWDRLEALRPDCLFVYITHDTHFASTHKAEKIWVSGYDGNRWKYEKLDDGVLTEEISLSILGSRQDILFVEGDEKSSLDLRLYGRIYRGYRVIPSLGCRQVMDRTKVYGRTEDLHQYSVCGLIDRDFRSDETIKEFRDKKIYTLGVAEIENLFLVDGVLRIAAEHLDETKTKEEADEAVRKIEEAVRDKFNTDIDHQIDECVATVLKGRANGINFPMTGEKGFLDCVTNDLPALFDVENTYSEVEKKFHDIAKSGSYDELLRVCNMKGNLNLAAGMLGFDDTDGYVDTVLTLMDDRKSRSGLIDAMKPYLPEEIKIY